MGLQDQVLEIKIIKKVLDKREYEDQKKDLEIGFSSDGSWDKHIRSLVVRNKLKFCL